MERLAALVTVVLVLGPVLLQMYLQRLPVAPACPECRATTREVVLPTDVLRLLPLFAATTFGECSYCGWRGRMRWKWAPRRLRRGPS